MTSPLTSGLAALGLDSASLHDALEHYLTEVTTWNERLGLVSVSGPDDLVVRHVLDSLAPWAAFRSWSPGSLVDLGSGAGFPGIPLTLAFPSVKTMLVERMEKRALFLESTLAALGRRDVAVVQKTFEEVRDTFDVVTFRAVTPLEPKIVKKLLRLLNPGGRIAAYKGRREVIDGELKALAPLGLQTTVLPLTVPFLSEERHLVVLER